MNIKFKLNKNFKKDDTFKKFENVLFKSMLKMHELAVINCPVDTGRLKNSINLNPMITGSKKYTLFDGVEYGVDLEYGTSPHYVSPKNLAEWSSRKLKDKNLAFAVSNKIMKRGTEAQPFFRPALDEVKNIWVTRYMNEILKKGNKI